MTATTPPTTLPLDLALQQASIHQQAGRLKEAEALWRAILQAQPGHPDAVRGLEALARPRPAAGGGLAGLLKAVKGAKPGAGGRPGQGGKPRQAGAVGQGMPDVERTAILRLYDTQRFAELEAKARQLTEKYPGAGLAWKYCGLAQLHQGKDPMLALPALRRAAEMLPDDSAAHNNLGVAQRELRQLDGALASYRRALELDPKSAAAHSNLGNVLREMGRWRDAADCFRHSLVLQPGKFEAHLGLGEALYGLGQLEEAEANARSARAQRPDLPGPHLTLANTLQAQGRLGDALDSVREGLALDPRKALAWNNLLLMMVYAEQATPEEIAAAARQFGQTVADPLRPAGRVFANPREAGRKLKVGYVSADLRDHAVSFFVEPVLEAHDRSQFELHAYVGPQCQDGVSQRLRAHFTGWHEIGQMDDAAAARQIEADGIDILVDLSGHTAGNRLLAFARKPAPVQVTWLGFPASSGMAAMDWRISDMQAEPPGLTEQLNTESLWRLPEVFCCYRAPHNSPAVAPYPPLQDNGFVTFGCFNNFAKVTDRVLALWAKILAQAPGSRLLLEIKGLAAPAFRAEVEARLARCGIELGRVELIPRDRANQYVLYNRIDIALDPFPCNGGTTTFDTLWMGVPLVTLAGRHFVSRMGVTLVTAACLPELVAASEDEYVATAVALACDPDRLARLRGGLRQRVAASPLMDAPRFTRNLEQAYAGMWQRWLASSETAPT